MARTITEREANLLAQFGFRFAHGVGGHFFTVFYDQIERVIPTAEGLEIAYKHESPLARTYAKVKSVDIPAGKMADGGEKNMDTAWIFVYYESIEHIDWDGKPYTD